MLHGGAKGVGGTLPRAVSPHVTILFICLTDDKRRVPTRAHGCDAGLRAQYSVSDWEEYVKALHGKNMGENVGWDRYLDQRHGISLKSTAYTLDDLKTLLDVHGTVPYRAYETHNATIIDLTVEQHDDAVANHNVTDDNITLPQILALTPRHREATDDAAATPTAAPTVFPTYAPTIFPTYEPTTQSTMGAGGDLDATAAGGDDTPTMATLTEGFVVTAGFDGIAVEMKGYFSMQEFDPISISTFDFCSEDGQH